LDLTIITGYPNWYILLCILAGILGSMILYFRENKSEFPAWLKRVLGVIRFLLISFLAFLLLSPLLKLTSHQVEKPVIIIAQDNSLSVVLNKDSAFYRGEYITRLNGLIAALQGDYEVRMFTFGEKVVPVTSPLFDTLNFEERQTELSSLFDMVDVRFVNRNIGALLIASDGIYNRGFNPLYHAAGIDYPVYTLAMGDTAERRDAFFERVLYNRIAFEGNDFPVEMIVNARKMAGTVLQLNISEAGRNIESRQIPVKGNNFSKTIRMNIPADKEGMHHYVITLISNRDEVTLENNRYDMFVDVMKSKQKILILANAPHPDISAIKDAIKSNINYEVDDILLEDLSGPLEAYSLVILHQLPSFSPLSSGLMNRLARAGTPLLFILGEQSDLQMFNRLNAGLQINVFSSGGLNEVQAVLNESFNTFHVSEGLADLIPFLPPLNTPFSRYTAANSARVLFTQKIGDIESGAPLWLLQSGLIFKSGVIAGTGLWKWRMKSWLVTGSHDLFNELITKNVQYLAVKDDKRQFRINTRQRYPENTPVSIGAELYNESYEPFNEPDVNMEIIDEEGNAYEYVFSRTGNGYILVAAGLEVGNYTYKASTHAGDKALTEQGGFAVTPVVAEQTRLRAAHDMLSELAEMQGGHMIDPEQMDSLPAILKERGDVKPILHAERKYIEFVDIWWMLIIILGLLSLEWFLRKWGGSY